MKAPQRPVVSGSDNRWDTRVVFTGYVKLFFKDHALGQYPARDLSQGGLFVEGEVNIPDGEVFRLELYDTGRHSNLKLTFWGKIVRRQREGVGVKFTSMQEDSFMFLQTMVLYFADDPVGAAERFHEDFPADIEITN